MPSRLSQLPSRYANKGDVQRILSLSRYEVKVAVVIVKLKYVELAQIFIFVLKYLWAILKVLNYYSLKMLPNFHHLDIKLIFVQTDSEYAIKKQQRMADRTIELAAKYKKTVENSFENDVMKKVKLNI
jgi:hypothetical protein